MKLASLIATIAAIATTVVIGQQDDMMATQTNLIVPISKLSLNTSIFPQIEHPHPPQYADPEFMRTHIVPTTSWISNLFYPSVEHLAPTTPDPYIFRVFDDYGGNPGLSVHQSSTKV